MHTIFDKEAFLASMHPKEVPDVPVASTFGRPNEPDRHEFVARLIDTNAFSTFVDDYSPSFRTRDVFDDFAAAFYADPSGVTAPTAEAMIDTLNSSFAATTEEFVVCEGTGYTPSSTCIVTDCGEFPALDDAKLVALEKEMALTPPLQLPGHVTQEVILKDDSSVHVPPVSANVVAASRVRTSTTTFARSLRHGSFSRRLKEGATSAKREEADSISQVLKTIFEGNPSDAHDKVAGLRRTFRDESSRYHFAVELSKRSHHSGQLSGEQFDLVVRLINHALRDEHESKEMRAAAVLLPILNSFY
eukprot:Opistho-2@14854